MWLTMKLVLSLSQMAFFVFVGKFVRGEAIIQYIAVGNALQVLAWNAVFSVINITSHDKWEGTLSYLLATPASRFPVFLGRAMMHVLDGILSVIIGFAYAGYLFGVDFSRTNFVTLSVIIVLTSFLMTGFGLMIGSFAFYFRSPLVIANIFLFILLIFCGVNFPIQELPAVIQPISYIFPLTYGIDAARQAVAGASILQVSQPLAYEVATGLAAVVIGYFAFIQFELLARKTGKLEEV